MKKYLILGFLLVGTYSNAAAQDSLRYGLLPSLSFNSDTKINVAIDLLRFNYGQNEVPFKNFSRYRASYNGLQAFSLSYFVDQVRTLNTDVRTTYEALITQTGGNYFLGNTIEEDFSKELFDTTSFYQFKSFLLNVGVSTRLPLTEVKGMIRTDVKLGLRYVYEKPFDLEIDSYMFQNQPNGVDGAALLFLETAYIIERRNSEFKANSGVFSEVGFKASIPGISTNNVALISGDVRYYKPLISSKRQLELGFAHRLRFNHTLGSIPYWFQPSLGGADGMRGFIWRRFSSDSSILSQTELRSVLFKLPYINYRIGVNLFVDAGSVYDRTFSDWDPRASYGIGAYLFPTNGDFILKYELGISEEGLGIYFGTGYSF